HGADRCVRVRASQPPQVRGRRHFRWCRRNCGWKGLATLSSSHERNPPAGEINPRCNRWIWCVLVLTVLRSSALDARLREGDEYNDPRRIETPAYATSAPVPPPAAAEAFAGASSYPAPRGARPPSP